MRVKILKLYDKEGRRCRDCAAVPDYYIVDTISWGALVACKEHADTMADKLAAELNAKPPSYFRKHSIVNK